MQALGEIDREIEGFVVDQVQWIEFNCTFCKNRPQGTCELYNAISLEMIKEEDFTASTVECPWLRM